MPEVRRTLHPDHLTYLRERGLTEETILAAGFSSARPQDLSRLAGRPVPEGVSGLVIPYLHADGFARVRLFPPLPSGDGKLQKFGQPAGSGVRAYVTQGAARVLETPEVPLYLTEGEVKALALEQAGFAAVGLGGIWNFRTRDLPEDGLIPDLEGVRWEGRIVYLIPDSDGWRNEHVLLAVYRFARLLEARGAMVLIVKLPDLAGLEKTGVDDFLVQREADALRKLCQKAMTLGHPVFRPLRLQEARTRHGEAPSPSAFQLLERKEERRGLHPAQDFLDGVLFYGIPVEGELVVVSSERRLLRADELPKGVTLKEAVFEARFSREGILRFLKGETIRGDALLRELATVFSRFIVFRDARLPLLLATWTLGTYLYKVFDHYPYLVLRSPTKRCGKTRTLDLLTLLCFNASPRMTKPSPAALFRIPDQTAGTLILDEVEHLKEGSEAEAALGDILNDGFQRGGKVPRLEKRGERYVPVFYETYGPKVLAGISRLTGTLEDRSLIVFMARKLKREAVDRFSPGRLERTVQRVRDACYTWALTHAADVAELYQVGEFPGLEALDDRAQNLWEPLLALALLADAEAEEAGAFASTLASLAHDLSGVRDEGETTTAKLLEALSDIVEAEGRETFTPTELLKRLQDRGFDWVKSPKALAGLLNPLGFVAFYGKVPAEGRRRSVRHYVLSPETLADLWQRYGGLEEAAEGAREG